MNFDKKYWIILTSLFFFCLEINAQSITWNEEKASQLTEKCKAYLTKTLLVYKDGKLVYDYGNPNKIYGIFSMRKSLVSLLYGVYANEGKINLDQTLASLDIDDINPLTQTEKQATILDLLKAKSGVYHKAAFETPRMVKMRPKRGTYQPGEHWFYNNWDFNALTTIFEQEVGISVFKAFEEKIAKPLKFEDFKIESQEYIIEEVSKHAATFWKLSGRDLLKLGVALLNQGKADEKTIIPNDWIQKSITPYADLGMYGAYGLCWWVALKGEHLPLLHLPDRTYSARGTGEQNMVILPTYNMVVIHQTEVTSPKDKKMKVTHFARLLKVILQ